MESNDFNILVKRFFGQRATQRTYARETKVFTAILYETFPLRCGLDGEHGTFTAGIETAGGSYLTTFFGKHASFNSDAESIIKSLTLIDEWCRLHLPDKFLARYEAAFADRVDEN